MNFLFQRKDVPFAIMLVLSPDCITDISFKLHQVANMLNIPQVKSQGRYQGDRCALLLGVGSINFH